MSTSRRLSWIPDEIRALAARGAVRGRSWTLAQLAEHLALAMEGTASEPINAGPPASWQALGPTTRFCRMLGKRGLLLTGIFPPRVKSPDIVAPSAAPDLDASLARLEAATAAFERKLANPAARWVAHPLLGPFTGPEWSRFHEVHARHHLRFFKRH